MAMVMLEKARDWNTLGGSSTYSWQDLPCFKQVKAEVYGQVSKEVSAIGDFSLKSAVASSNPPELTPSVASFRWSPKDSRKLYAVDGWGAPYFAVSDQGHLCVKPEGGRRRIPSLFCWCRSWVPKYSGSD